MRLPRRRPRPDRQALDRFLHGDDATEPMRTYPSAGSRYQPAPTAPDPAPPPRTHQVTGRDFRMVVNTETPAPLIDSRVRAALQHLKLEAADYAAQGMLYRIDDAEQARQRGEPLDDRSVIAQTVAKAVRHLMGPREPWDPSGWDHALTSTPPPAPAGRGLVADVPWPDPDDGPAWLAAYERELGHLGRPA